MTPGVPVSWCPREVPLAPIAVAACGPAAVALGRRLLRLAEPELSRLEGISAPGLLVVLGPEEALPWVDGAVYLGRDPDAARLLLPTNLRPSVSPCLLEGAMTLRYPVLAAPVAVLPGPSVLASAAGARAIDRGVLTAWLEGQPR